MLTMVDRFFFGSRRSFSLQQWRFGTVCRSLRIVARQAKTVPWFYSRTPFDPAVASDFYL